MAVKARKKTFLIKSEIKVYDFEHKRKLQFNIGKYDAKVGPCKEQFENLDEARKYAKNRKWEAIEHLDKYLIQFEENFKANGGKIIWAANTKDAQQAIQKICKKYKTKTVVKSKSMVTEEIHLNEFLESKGIESVETDLGEYIQQLDGEAPYHIVTPAMHKSKEDIARLFHDKLNTDANLSPEELTLIARENLREKYTEAQVGITGGNFLVADTGGVCLTENEGNARLSCTFPPVHIAIVGIEKMLPSIDDLQVFWPLLSTFGTGQKVTVYNSIFHGPKKEGEVDGPEEMYLILLDNGRSKLIADPKVRESAYCIRCGACLNACPIYKNIGGHAYGTTYSGPIGSVITPHLKNFKEYNHLSHASSLCGACTESCPVKINIHNMLHYNRTLYVKKALPRGKENTGWSAWRLAMKNRLLLDLTPAGLKSWVSNRIFKKSWVEQRGKMNFQKSFKAQYRKMKKK